MSVLFTLTVGSSARCRQAVQFCWDIAGARLVVAPIYDIHPANLELDIYALD